MHEFFSFNFPLREYFFWYPPPPPPNKFSNGPSLMSLRQKLNGFWNHAKLASWSYSAQVKDRKAPSDPSWPRFCYLRCFFRKNVFFLFWKLSYFKCTNKKNVNNVCFNSRNVTFKQDYPCAANNWKFYLWRWEENMYTIFC